uniref:AgAcp34A-3 n=2 Tax=gambiae species complex TaxID=44542 RepID=G8I267_ANOGA|nr:AgAcp34A-3 [Anopheles gambiae]AER11414.1 AgAcp34A-3 [Anopheles gambiae]AER11431.1 AgAcp34A-3 [Anopheles gambiae]AER11432.1 AgAcp34A-3 [Anopheles gambiae]AER11433.1 AgAcp34A-3 [Anopheles arabiensis]
MKTVIVLLALVAVATAMQPFYHPQEQFPVLDIIPKLPMRRQVPKIIESFKGLVEGFINFIEGTRRGDPVDRENMRQLLQLLELLPPFAKTLNELFGQ